MFVINALERKEMNLQSTGSHIPSIPNYLKRRLFRLHSTRVPRRPVVVSSVNVGNVKITRIIDVHTRMHGQVDCRLY
jgi:hypothetical protein